MGRFLARSEEAGAGYGHTDVCAVSGRGTKGTGTTSRRAAKRRPTQRAAIPEDARVLAASQANAPANFGTQATRRRPSAPKVTPSSQPSI